MKDVGVPDVRIIAYLIQVVHGVDEASSERIYTRSFGEATLIYRTVEQVPFAEADTAKNIRRKTKIPINFDS